MAKITQFNTNHTKEQLAYLAGIIDGEGCFYVGKVKQGKYGSGYQFHTTIKVDNTHRPLIDFLNQTFGGKREYSYWKKNPNHKPVYAWYSAGMMLDYICPLILPYLIVKKQQCELMIEIRKTYKNIGSKRLPQNIIDARLDIISKMRKLNSRGHNNPLKQENTCPLSP